MYLNMYNIFLFFFYITNYVFYFTVSNVSTSEDIEDQKSPSIIKVRFYWAQ